MIAATEGEAATGKVFISFFPEARFQFSVGPGHFFGLCVRRISLHNIRYQNLKDTQWAATHRLHISRLQLSDS